MPLLLLSLPPLQTLSLTGASTGSFMPTAGAGLQGGCWEPLDPGQLQGGDS